jgi:riboflavin synthase alpha subunit
VSSLAKIQESDVGRAGIFRDSCTSCQGSSLSNEIDLVEDRNSEVMAGGGGGQPHLNRTLNLSHRIEQGHMVSGHVWSIGKNQNLG